MPREHADIKMTPEELRQFLASNHRLIVATVDAAGTGWADAAAYTFFGDRVYFRLPVDSRAYRNIQGDNRVCCVVEGTPATASYYDIKGAMLHGAVEDERSRPLSPAASETLAAVADPVTPDGGGDSIVYSVGLGDHTSFMFAKIKYRYQDRSVHTIQAEAGLA